MLQSTTKARALVKKDTLARKDLTMLDNDTSRSHILMIILYLDYYMYVHLFKLDVPFFDCIQLNPTQLK